MKSLNIGVIGAGVIGRYHAESLACRIPRAQLAVIADPNASVAKEAAAVFGVPFTAEPQTLIEDPKLDAVVICSPGSTHAALIAQAARAGKPVFCEKPLAWDLPSARSALDAVQQAGTLLQIGFQRRFDPSIRKLHELVENGKIGQVQLLRSLTRDPVLNRPEVVPPWAIFRETLIHDFDVLCWLSGQKPVEVFAMADALVAPSHKPRGLRDTATVMVRFEGGAMATADASFQAVYGYDVRAEVFGSAGMGTADLGNANSARHLDKNGETRERVFWFLELFGSAYTAELAGFVQAVLNQGPSPCSGEEAYRALQIAMAAIESVETGKPVSIS